MAMAVLELVERGKPQLELADVVLHPMLHRETVGNKQVDGEVAVPGRELRVVPEIEPVSQRSKGLGLDRGVSRSVPRARSGKRATSGDACNWFLNRSLVGTPTRHTHAHGRKLDPSFSHKHAPTH
jgi:hypothetical protein